MKRSIKFAVLFILALPLVSFLPLFIKQTMTRSQTSGGGGDVISWSWECRSFYGFLSDFEFSRPEETFYLYLAVNLALACIYAFGAAFLARVAIGKLGRNKI